jgi:hypothetical protein
MSNILLDSILGKLWDDYINRVDYAKRYVQLVNQHKGNVVNDHIAFRTINTGVGSLVPGIEGVARVFRALGYIQKGEYHFTDKHLYAQHFEHLLLPDAPRIFISQLEVKELPSDIQDLIIDTVKDGRDYLMESLKDGKEFLEVNLPMAFASMNHHTQWRFIDAMWDFFVGNSRPWSPPQESVVRRVNEVSQYGAWTLLFGNSVNHFTAFINKQNVPQWPNIEATIKALIEDGLPMKPEIEGLPGSKLRQTATKAVVVIAPVIKDNGQPDFIDWPYAYYEFAERGFIDGNLFTGFLGPQATHLFEMTKKD